MSAAETGQIHTPAHAPLSEKDFASNPKDQSKDSASSSNMTDAPAAPAPAVKAPFPHPLPQCKPPTPAALTADQEKKYQELLESVKKWEKVPKSTDKKPEEEPLSDDERMWLTKECLLRYLRAVKWASAAAAEKRLLDTVIWRREYGTNTFTADYISPENETGKLIILGYDNDGRPCLYMDPSKQNTEKSDRQVHNLVFMLEKAIDLMPAGVESIALLINFKNSTSAKNPSLGQGKQVLNILQGQYPERNGKSLISELPWYVSTFFKLISPFIDPVTKDKMKFNEPFGNFIPPSQLMKTYGGEVEFEYDHSVYWPTLNQMCDKLRAERKARWEARGKQIGDSEFAIKGGEEAAAEP
ncbi:Cellular retinaldehyde-binding/triple function [Botryosphaeria dothidea]|uniref:Cellular retinaldehyde-binding/triple function n=1 Tax=Botryosphaeria dothidea TaxID=55169 RepID=A0A8H4N2N8_9PEZI|nr:Cellular retinaldehyde-binding/triple function [Botryosphaeria dothidea]